MGGRTANQKRKQQGKEKPSPLQTSFSKASATTPAAAGNKRAATPADVGPTRRQHSGFLSYLRFATKDCKDTTVQNQAMVISQQYSKMNGQQKKDMITDFFRGGGKRPGLSIIYKQVLVMSSSVNESEWQGYATIGMLLDLHKAPM